MPKTALNHSLCRVNYGKRTSFGGSQTESCKKRIQGYGCGVVAASEVLVYLWRGKAEKEKSTAGDSGLALILSRMMTDPVTAENYNSLVDYIEKKYLHVIPNFGITGISLASALNRMFLKLSLPYCAVWSVGERKLFQNMETMLQNNIPVIISAGPGLPFIRKKESLPLYRPGNTLRSAAGAKEHYMTATAIDGEFIYLSSWGNEYIVRKQDFIDYVKRCSNFITSNIVLIRKK